MCACSVTQLCLTPYDSMGCSPPGSSVHGILQTRILQWVAMPSSRGSSWPRDQTCISCIAGGFFATCSKFWATSHSKYSQERFNQPVFSTVPMTQRENFFLPSIRVPLVSISFHHLTASKKNKKSPQSCHLYGNSFLTMLICNNFSVTAVKENTVTNRIITKAYIQIIPGSAFLMKDMGKQQNQNLI